MLPELYILKEIHFIWKLKTTNEQPLLPYTLLDQDLVALDVLHHLCIIICSHVSDMSAITSSHQLPKRSKSLFFLPAVTQTNEFVSITITIDTHNKR